MHSNIIVTGILADKKRVVTQGHLLPPSRPKPSYLHAVSQKFFRRPILYSCILVRVGNALSPYGFRGGGGEEVVDGGHWATARLLSC